MPEISAVAIALGTRFIKPTGVVFRGVLKPPPPAGPGFEAGYMPRRSLYVSKDADLKAGEVITDTSGTRYICADWSPDGLLGVQATKSFVLFGVTAYEKWSRQVFVTEPISGQRKLDKKKDLGTIPVSVEFTRRKNDNLDIEEEIYLVVTGSPVQLGDFLEERRVQKVDRVLGVYRCETF